VRLTVVENVWMGNANVVAVGLVLTLHTRMTIILSMESLILVTENAHTSERTKKTPIAYPHQHPPHVTPAARKMAAHVTSQQGVANVVKGGRAKVLVMNQITPLLQTDGVMFIADTL